MAHPSSLSFPHKAVIRFAHAEPEFGSDCRQNHRLGATRSYEEAPHTLHDDVVPLALALTSVCQLMTARFVYPLEA